MNTMFPVFNEAERLYRLGFAVHWIKPNSKAPVNSGWADGTKEDFRKLTADFRNDYGLGVRLGKASRFPDGTYLANLDIDIKSSDPRDKDEAIAMARRLFPLAKQCPAVATGYGIRLFFRTTEPLQSKRLAASNKKALVFMPGSPVSKEQLKYEREGVISRAELEAGTRVRPCWELELMSAGKQVVLPPSIHPDTKKAYEWESVVFDYTDMPVFDGKLRDLPSTSQEPNKVETTLREPTTDRARGMFRVAFIDPLDTRMNTAMWRLIHGEGVDDRSAAAFSLTLMMVRAGFTDDEILTVLTDKDTFIGETSFDHRKTTNRENAADWARNYCLKKARAEADAAKVFEGVAIIESGGLSDEDAERQAKLLIRERPWKEKLTRSGKDGEGGVKPTLGNVLLILENVVSPVLFKRDSFAQQEFYGSTAPWTGAKIGKALTDDDAVAIKEWLSGKFGFEPSLGLIYEAMTAVSIRNAYHPVQEELRALPAWDGKARLATWLARHFAAEGPGDYLGQVFTKWLVASITRTFEPGAKFDWLPIFEGNQGVGKSTFGSILFGQKYFADSLPNLADKEAALQLRGKLCIEFGELESMRRNELATVKAFITRQYDNVRPPYGRKSLELARGTVFMGTVDKGEYLQDDAGNRRFNPVKVGKLDFHALARDREQLWAEALLIYDMGLEPTLYLEGGAAADAVALQKEKRVQDDSDLMARTIEDWAAKERQKPDSERFPLDKFRIEALFGGMGPLGGYKYEMKFVKLAGKALNSLGATHWKSHGSMTWSLENPTK